MRLCIGARRAGQPQRRAGFGQAVSLAVGRVSGGTSGITRIAVGRVRDHVNAMQIVSGANVGEIGREVVHYEVPPSAQVALHMDQFLAWFESSRPTGRVTGTSKATATRDAVNVPGWEQPAPKP